MKLIHYLWNPFKTLNERVLLLGGIIITIIGMILSIFFNVIQDGVLDLHLANTDLLSYIFAVLIDVALLTVCLWACGMMINPKTRFIDILNVVLVARIWLYQSIPIVGNSYMKEVTEKIVAQGFQLDPSNLNIADIGMLLVLSFFTIFFLVYFLIFLYNGFKVAVHATQWKHVVFYVITIFVAEVISKLLFYIIL